MDLRTTARSRRLRTSANDGEMLRRKLSAVGFRATRLATLAGVAIVTLSTAAIAGDARTPESAAVAGSDAEIEFVQRRSERIKHLPAAAVPPQVSGPTFNPIDQFIVAAWSKAGPTSVGPTPDVCDDATFARRAYLDLTGVVPTVVELNQFLVDSSDGKRRKLVDHLLSRRADYAAHWTPFWEDALASQTVLAQGGIPTRGNYRDWILQSFEQPPVRRDGCRAAGPGHARPQDGGAARYLRRFLHD